ncbi:hypothetical protein [Nonomuraea angiospora]|uniref:hypothetical protein n=1 Tax=Nonomuraea angiospora TaxID=46172 RepID=UPI0029B8D614|nr:hypothetical protein [Nonomuraea angiospora]MDX3099976.1 hypothetical protein [Nonomuraea angiospora]
MSGYNRLSKAQAGAPPRTSKGESIREIEIAAHWLAMPLSSEAIHTAARQIRQRPTPHDPQHIRAARAQLVFYELRSLEAKVARADAQARGASAQPIRDLKTAVWAAPLRTDSYAFELLLDTIQRLRHGARDPLDIPTDLIDRAPNVGRSHAQRMVRSMLEELRRLHPGFYCANVITYLPMTEVSSEDAQITAPAPEELLISREDTQLARQTLTLLIAGQPTLRSKEHYRNLLRGISATVPPDGSQLLTWVTRMFGIDKHAAESFVRKLIHLACLAGLDWLAKQCV